MSPSRRRAIARGGSPPRCVASHLALPAAPHRACLLARSRTPSETLKSPAVAHRLCAPIHPVPSLFVTLCVKNNRTFAAPRCANSHHTRSLPVRRDGDIAPYRHYARKIRTHITHARCARRHYSRHGARARSRAPSETLKIARGCPPPLCSYPSRPFALCAPLC